MFHDISFSYHRLRRPDLIAINHRRQLPAMPNASRHTHTPAPPASPTRQQPEPTRLVAAYETVQPKLYPTLSPCQKQPCCGQDHAA